LATLRESFIFPINLGLDQALQDLVLLQHLYTGLDSTTLGGVFLSLSISEVRFVLISGDTPCTSLHDKILEVEKESSPKLEEEVFVATLQTFRSHDSAIHPKSVVLQNLQREEEILPLEICSSDFGRSFNFLLHKRSFSAYSLNFQRRSLRKLFKSNPHEGYLGRLKDGKSSDAIVGEQNHIEDNPIFSPSMPTLDDLYEPTIQPILDPDESYSALSPKPLDDPRKPSTHIILMNILDHQEDQEEQHQWLKSIKTRYAIAIEYVDEALYKTNLKGNPRDVLDIYDKSPLEVSNHRDFDEQGSYSINTSSSLCLYETPRNSIGLSNLFTFQISNPLILSIYKNSKMVVVDAYVYHKYCRSHSALKVGVVGETTLPKTL